MTHRKPMSEARRRALSEQAKARWMNLTAEAKAAHYRRQAATMMGRRPELAIWPERWLRDLAEQEPEGA